jgi:hypothetical protein
MLELVFGASLALLAVLLIDPLRQRFAHRRRRGWRSYFRN